MPIVDSAGNPRAAASFPSRLFPALVLLPFVADLARGHQRAAAGRDLLRGRRRDRVLDARLSARSGARSACLTALFLGLGTVLWYTAAIGTHLVLGPCRGRGLPARWPSGLALSADREAAEPRPLAEEFAAARRPAWPGGWRSAACARRPRRARRTALRSGGGWDRGCAGRRRGHPDRRRGGRPGCGAVGRARRPGAAGAGRRDSRRRSGGPDLRGSVSPGAGPGGPRSRLAALVGLGALARLGRVLWMRVSRPSGWPWIGPSRARSRPGCCSAWHVTARLTIVFGFPFLILVGGGGTLAAAWPAGRRRGGDPAGGAAGLHVRGHRPPLQPRVRLPVPPRARLHVPQLPRRLVDRGPALRAPEPDDHAVQHADLQPGDAAVQGPTSSASGPGAWALRHRLPDRDPGPGRARA